jgi:hypothetical protein
LYSAKCFSHHGSSQYLRSETQVELSEEEKAYKLKKTLEMANISLLEHGKVVRA